jgi:phosphoribosylamine--glycine ligase
MRILILGNGGREHALAWKLKQSPGVTVFGTPLNLGIKMIGACHPGNDRTPRAFLEIAESIHADLTVVGPEVPLVEGVVDLFRERGMKIVGPDRKAAQLEGSKIFAKDFLTKSKIPTAEYVTVANSEAAGAAIGRFGYPVVLKADGLAAGKGVVIAHDAIEAEAALSTLKGRLVVEEFLTGEEVSFIALCDGRDALPLAPTQDHKAAFDGDQGPNTGGMGAYCDSAILTETQTRYIMRDIIYPTVEATGFTGFLYAGLMMTADGPKVLEFNVRLGDPETQPLMHRMASDFVPVLMAAAEGRLGAAKLEWHAGPSVCVVLASAGYPGAYKKGAIIHGIPQAEATGAVVFHAGTTLAHNGIVTEGGRVLGVTASGADLGEAIANTYRGVEQIHFDGMHFRRDIGRKGIERYNKSIVGT